MVYIKYFRILGVSFPDTYMSILTFPEVTFEKLREEMEVGCRRKIRREIICVHIDLFIFIYLYYT